MLNNILQTDQTIEKVSKRYILYFQGINLVLDPGIEVVS